MWELRRGYPATLMARLLGVSRSGYYSWVSAGGPADPLAGLKGVVTALREGGGGVFGWRRVKAELPPEWSGSSGYSVKKSMRELGMRGHRPRSRKRTTVQDPDAPARPDLVRRRFEPPVPTTVLVGDITYLRTGEGWLYLASVIGLATRMVVGWSFSARMTADTCVPALEMAKRRGYVAGGAIFHGDRGSQYTSALLAEWAAANDVRLSVGRTGCCRDNAVAESLRASLKNEMYHRRTFATRREAKLACVDWTERFYNRSRPHSSIGYRRPAELMEEFVQRMEGMFERESEKENYLAA